jgi:ribonucleoside-diphosphate reductase alpha chain
MTTNEDIPFAKSLVDYIFRWMGMQFIPGYRAANAPQRGIAERHEPPVVEAPVRKEDPAWGSPRLATAEPKPAANGHHEPVGRISGESWAATVTRERTEVREGAVSLASSTLTVAMESMGDAPACDVCGTITVRSGTCYKCLNCGNSMGCS